MTYHGVKIERFGFENPDLYRHGSPYCLWSSLRRDESPRQKDEKVLDFGENLVGYVSFELDDRGRSDSNADPW